jgi:hypothetical protein
MKKLKEVLINLWVPRVWHIGNSLEKKRAARQIVRCVPDSQMPDHLTVADSDAEPGIEDEIDGEDSGKLPHGVPFARRDDASAQALVLRKPCFNAEVGFKFWLCTAGAYSWKIAVMHPNLLGGRSHAEIAAGENSLNSLWEFFGVK